MINPNSSWQRPSDARAEAEGQAERPAAEPRSFVDGRRPQTGLDALAARQSGRGEDLSSARVDGGLQEAPLALEGDPQRRALIVVPTLNEDRTIGGVLANILGDERLVDPLVVVADGGSTDGTRGIVRKLAQQDPRVRLMDNPARLQSAGVNLAVRTFGAGRPWLVRLDAHSDYPANYCSRLIDEAFVTGATSVVVSVHTVGSTVFQRAVAAAQNCRLGTGGSPHRQASAGQWVDHGHHGLISMAAYQQVGGYDETFSHNEDAELDARLLRQGGRIWLTDKVRSSYYPRRTPAALLKQYFNYGSGRARTVLKHHLPLKMRQALPLAVAPAAFGLLLAPLYWALALPALIWASAVTTLGALLAIRHRDATLLLSGPAAMIMHLGWSAGFWSQLLPGGPRRR